MRMDGTQSRFGRFLEEKNLLLPLLYSSSSPAPGLVTVPTELSGCASEKKTKGNGGRKKYNKTEHKVREKVKKETERDTQCT